MGILYENFCYSLLLSIHLRRYFDHFPPVKATPPGRGVVPVWGMGTVIASKNALVAKGESVYGFFPVSFVFPLLKPLHFRVHCAFLLLDGFTCYSQAGITARQSSVR